MKGNQRSARLEIDPAHRVTLRVQDSSDRPIAGATVWVLMASPPDTKIALPIVLAFRRVLFDMGSGKTDAEGRLAVVLPLTGLAYDVFVYKGGETVARQRVFVPKKRTGTFEDVEIIGRHP